MRPMNEILSEIVTLFGGVVTSSTRNGLLRDWITALDGSLGIYNSDSEWFSPRSASALTDYLDGQSTTSLSNTTYGECCAIEVVPGVTYTIEVSLIPSGSGTIALRVGDDIELNPLSGDVYIDEEVSNSSDETYSYEFTPLVSTVYFGALNWGHTTPATMSLYDISVIEYVASEIPANALSIGGDVVTIDGEQVILGG